MIAYRMLNISDLQVIFYLNYFSATSSGNTNGQDNTRGGVCSQHQMRVKFVVSHGGEFISLFIGGNWHILNRK